MKNSFVVLLIVLLLLALMLIFGLQRRKKNPFLASIPSCPICAER